MRFQVTSKLIRPNICIMQTVRQRIPNCWARNGESTSAESAATDARNDELTAQIPKFCYTNTAFSLETHCGRHHTCTCGTKFLHHLSTGCCLPKQRLGPKLEGGGLGEQTKIWDPLHISATVENSNFKFATQLGFETSLPKNNVLD